VSSPTIHKRYSILLDVVQNVWFVAGCCIILLTKVRQALPPALMNSAYVVAKNVGSSVNGLGICIPNVSALLEYLLRHAQHNAIQALVSVFSSTDVLYSFPCHAQHLTTQ